MNSWPSYHIFSEVLIERQWRGRSCRQECDFFWDQVNKHESREEVPPILSNVNTYLISIYRDSNFLLVTTSEDSYALFVIEFLHRVYDVFEEYFKASRGSLGTLGSLGNLTSSLGSLRLTGSSGGAGSGGTSESDVGVDGTVGGYCVLDEGVIKDNFSVIYSLLEELLDYGFPLTTELNALKEIIEPPTLLSKLRGAVSTTTGLGVTARSGPTSHMSVNLGLGTPSVHSGSSGTSGSSPLAPVRFSVSEPSPDGTLANMPWRKSNVIYATNEVYFDIVEELDCLLDDTGNMNIPVASSAYGTIMCNSKLSGVPDLSLRLLNAHAIADCSFHPCVRYTRFERDYTLSFVPPDGVFELMRYRVNCNPDDSHHNAAAAAPNSSSHDSRDNNMYKNSRGSSSNNIYGMRYDINSPSNPNPNPNTNPIGDNVNACSGYTAPLNCQAHMIWDLNHRSSHPTARLAITLTHRPLCSLITANIVTTSASTTTNNDYSGHDSTGTGHSRNSYKNKLPVEDIIVAVPLPRHLVQTMSSVNISSGCGTTLFDEHTKTLRWRVPKLVPDKPLQLTAVLALHPVEHALDEPLAATISNPVHRANASNAVFLTAAEVISCHVQWKVPTATLSGIAVQGLSLVNENYKPFKGVRTLTKSGHMEIRMASILAT